MEQARQYQEDLYAQEEKNEKNLEKVRSSLGIAEKHANKVLYAATRFIQ